MHAAERSREQPVAPEREECARRGKHHPARVAEGRDGGTQTEQNAERCRDAARRGRERRGLRRERRPEYPLRHDLDRDVEERNARKRNEQRAGNRSRRILDLAARDERALDAREREKENDRRPANLGHCGRSFPCQLRRIDEERAHDNQHHQRQQLRDGHDLDETRAVLHASDVDRGEHAEKCRQEQRTSHPRTERRNEGRH